jgi:hypothetical protein
MSSLMPPTTAIAISAVSGVLRCWPPAPLTTPSMNSAISWLTRRRAASPSVPSPRISMNRVRINTGFCAMQPR